MYNFKSVSTSNTKYCSYKDWKIKDYVVGEVLRFTPNQKNPKYQDIIVKILDSNIKTDKVELLEGDLFTVNGTTALQKAIDTGIEVDNIIKVVFLGKEKVKGGQWKGTMANKLEVFVADKEDSASFDEDDIL